MDQTHQPTIMRRQSLPEGFLSQNKAFQVTGFSLENSSDEKITKQTLKAETTDNHFKHSQIQRFGRHTKRKSQSLYESSGLQQNPHKQAEPLMMSPEFPVLTRVHSSPPGSAMFSIAAPLKQEKGIDDEDEELDFLIPHQTYTSSTSTNATDDKDMAIHAVPFSDDPNGFPFEVFNGPNDDFHHNIHQNFNPGGGSQQVPYYDQGPGPLNFSQFPSKINTYPINPLNNFTIHDQTGLLSEQSVSGPAEALSLNYRDKFAPNYATENLSYKKGDAKRRRSRIPSSPYRGVSRCGKDNKFQARIRVQGKVKYLGRFKSEIEAAKCYDRHAIEYLGVNAQTNFPIQVQHGPISPNFENKEKF